MLGHFAEELGQPIVVDLELELLVDAVSSISPLMRWNREFASLLMAAPQLAAYDPSGSSK